MKTQLIIVKLGLIFMLAGKCFYACIAQQKYPNQKQLFFKRISSDQGLLQPSVNDILRDSRGFVWVATEEGLSRFDGSEVKTFRHVPGDSTSLSHNVVHFIHEDLSSGDLWIGTVSGVNFFDRSRERFTVFKTDTRPGTVYANAALDKKRGRLWLACTVGGLQFLDLSRQRIFDFPGADLSNRNIWTVKMAGDSLILGTLNGLQILDLETLRNTHIDTGCPVRALWIDGNDIWFGTEGRGLGKLDLRTKKVIYYNKANGGTNNDYIWSLSMDQDHNLWIGTDGGGLNILTAAQQSFFYRHSELDERSLSANTIRSIFVEPGGNVWLGTYNGGVNYYEVPPIPFLFYKHESFDDHSLRNNSVSAFAEADDGTVWIGSDGGGLHYLKEGVVYRFELPPALKDVDVITSLLCSEGNLWIGTYQNGLVYLDGKGNWKQFLHNPRDKNSISNNNVWCLAQDRDGKLWVGTDRGLNRLTIEAGVFHHLDNPLSGVISELFIDLPAQTLLVSSANTLWAGSYGLLMAYFPAEDSVAVVNAVDPQGRIVTDLRVKALLEDQEKIWIGTYGNGLCQYNTVTQKFYILDERDGLPDNTILGIQADKPGGLWLSTNRGLTYFDSSGTNFTVMSPYYGVQGTIFNRNATLRTRDGHLFFGGTRGFNVFKPRPFGHKQDAPSVVLTDFLIFNRQIKPGHGLLEKSITEADEIDLPHADSRLITFQFSAFHFLSPDNVIYQYQLQGFDDHWQLTRNRSVTFTNLDPGVYTLVVRASLNGKAWGPQKALPIVIQALWWKTVYFRWSVFILVLLVALGFYRYRTYQMKKRRMELEKLVNQQSIKIKQQNQDLAAQNETLRLKNEEMSAQQKIITGQNLMLEDSKRKLQEINESLEQTVQHRTERLNETILRLNKTIKELDAFVYSASHDLIAPLKSVMGLIHLMRKETRQDELVSYTDRMETSIKKLEDVIQSMIQHSHNANLDVGNEVVNLYMLVTDCLSDIRFFPGAEAIRFDMDIDKMLTVTTDKKRVQIIINNLISNAVKYRDVRKDVSFVKISVEKGKTVWKLQVHDNGIGIAKPYLSRIFEMFYRATDRSQGSGLGLYIVKETVERLYGEVYVDSELGQWTTFTVTIPNEGIYVRKK